MTRGTTDHTSPGTGDCAPDPRLAALEAALDRAADALAVTSLCAGDAAAILADPAFREALTAAVIAAFQEVQPGVYGTDWPFDDPDDFTFVNPTEHARAIIAHLLPEAEK